MPNPFATLRSIRNALDPNEDPAVEPVSALFVVVFSLLAAVSAWTFLRYRIPPMQDFGRQAALAALVADPARLHAARSSLDWTSAGSLVISLAGYAGRLIPVTSAMRACVVFVLVGTPSATLYALRTFGRSAWSSVVSIALVHGAAFVTGPLDFVVAAPFLLASIALFERFLTRPSRGRGVAVGLAFACTFLANLQVYLFLALVAAGQLVASLVRGAPRFTPLAVPRTRILGGAILSAIPSLLLFGRWAVGALAATHVPLASTAARSADAAMHPSVDELFRALFGIAIRATYRVEESRFVVALVFLTLGGFVTSRLVVPRGRRVLEAAFFLAIALYFLLPDPDGKGHVLRQVTIATWFLPALLAPVPARTSVVLRAFAIVALVSYTALFLRFWYVAVEDFQRMEVNGLDRVLQASPRGLRLLQATPDPGSTIFRGQPFAHLEGLYAAERSGIAQERPEERGVGSRARREPNPAIRFDRPSDVATNERVFREFDLVLVRRFQPTPEQRASLEPRASLVVRVGDWQLWRARSTEPTPDPRAP